MEGDAGGVLGKDAGLDGPDSGLAGDVDGGLHESAAGTLALPVGADVDRVLDHPGVAAAVGEIAGGGPPDDSVGVHADEAEIVSMGGVPIRPVGYFGFEGGVARGVDGGHLGPVCDGHGRDGQVGHGAARTTS
jgi:hypothetical protein